MTTYSVYCDESAHLRNDHQPVMVLGAVWCRTDRVRSISRSIRAIKKAHGLSPRMELKWTKVSPGKIDFYLSVVDRFFDEEDLRFRALVIPDKDSLNHDAFLQDHDTWYYKMYFLMLRHIISPRHVFRIYLDIKDTRSEEKVRKLHEVLCNDIHDFGREVVERVQTVRSHEVELLQLADLLIGGVRRAQHARGGQRAKDLVVRRIQVRSGYALRRSTPLAEPKFNVFVWRGREARGDR